jgi:hypothetical protein
MSGTAAFKSFLMGKSMKPGYYLSEMGNFQVWYPKGFFEEDKQRMDVVLTDGTNDTINYTKVQAILISKIFDFEFIGEL